MMEDHWLTRPRTIRRLWWIFAAVLVATVLAELFLAHEPHFRVERVFGFYALYGFLACGAMIVVAKALGLALKRDDDYYDKRVDD